MTEKFNNKSVNLIKYYSLINYNLIFNNKTINRYRSKNSITSESLTNKLEALKNSILNVKNCDLKKNAKNMVFSDGNPQSKIMIIGEGPGANEDKEGLPFVGRAGQLLNKMLSSIKLNRENVYITNVVNYRPPENRKPTEKEIAKYFSFLSDHIQIINPKIILLLGSTALSAILGDKEVISKARGKWFKLKIGNIKTLVIASFHPAFLMRQPDQKKYAWIDLKMIREKIKELQIKIE